MFRTFADLLKSMLRSATQSVLSVSNAQAVRKAIVPHRAQPVETPPSLERLTSLQGAGRGQRCLILGTAPSARDADLRTLDVDYTFLLNRAYLHEQRPDTIREAIVIADPHAFSEYGDVAIDRELDRVFLSSCLSGINAIDPRLVFFAQWEQPRIYDGFFQSDALKPLYHGHSVVFYAIQLAAWMRFSEIVLAGVDFDFSGAEGHFYASSATERKRKDKNSVRKAPRMIKSLQYCVQYLQATGGPKIYSVSPNRTLDFIEYRSIDDFSET